MTIFRHRSQDFLDYIYEQTRKNLPIYKLRRVINILGTEEILRRLRENKRVVPVA